MPQSETTMPTVKYTFANGEEVTFIIKPTTIDPNVHLEIIY
jgi:hypothetical protein